MYITSLHNVLSPKIPADLCTIPVVLSASLVPLLSFLVKESSLLLLLLLLSSQELVDVSLRVSFTILVWSTFLLSFSEIKINSVLIVITMFRLGGGRQQNGVKWRYTLQMTNNRPVYIYQWSITILAYNWSFVLYAHEIAMRVFKPEGVKLLMRKTGPPVSRGLVTQPNSPHASSWSVLKV